MRGQIMAFVLSASLTLISSAQAAQAASSTPLNLARALALAPANDPDVIAAQADLVAAEGALSRQLADPLALTVGDLEAESATEAARAALASAQLTNRSETSNLFFAVLSAEADKALAARTLALARSVDQAAEIRADVGAASGLELLTAQNSFAEAQRAKAAADEASLLAYRELADATGLSTTTLLLRGLAPVGAAKATVPTLAESLTRAQRENTDVAAARTAVQVAEAQLKASDTIFSARVDVEAAADEVTRAESELTATLRQLQLSVRSAHSDLTSAVRAFTEARATRRAYAQELEAQRLRLQAGAISESDFGEAEVTDLTNAQAVRSALYTMRLSRLALEGSVVGSGAVTGGTASSTVSGTGAESDTSAEGAASETDTDVTGGGSSGTDDTASDTTSDTTGTAADEDETATDTAPADTAPAETTPTDEGAPASP